MLIAQVFTNYFAHPGNQVGMVTWSSPPCTMLLYRTTQMWQSNRRIAV